MDERLFTELEMSNLAFQLIASSTANRYARYARLLAKHTKLAKSLENKSISPNEVLDRAKILWNKILQSDFRDADEIELSGIIPLLLDSSFEEAYDFIQAISLNTTPIAMWLASLAKIELEK